jgi:glucose/arabinose dehydrogenase
MKKLLSIFIVIVILVLLLLSYLTIFKLIYQGIKPAFLPSKKIEKFATTSFENQQSQVINLPLKLPPNFSIFLFAENLGKARDLEFDPKGRLTVVSLSGQVFLLEDKDQNNIADENKILLTNLNKPHSIQFLCEKSCKLYLAQEDGIYVYDYDPEKILATNPKKIIDLPTGGRHITRTILIFNNKIYISVGSSCDVCYEKDWRRGKILVANLDGTNLKEYARGLRNSVFMTIHPVTGEIWATEMGRDWLSDNLPPDEINIIREGKNYGWPICYGKNIHDSDFDKNIYIRNPCMEPLETESYIDIPAHSAPLGLAFFQEEGWPEEYWYNLLVAYHGSWNRSVPTGYKIVRYKLDSQGKFLGVEDFITGWLGDNSAWGRPVDIIIQPRVIYISDDKAGVIYKLIYTQ